MNGLPKMRYHNTYMIDAVILAGGESTRFWPFTHKILMPFFGKPLLLWHYEQLLRLGFRNVVVVANADSLTDIRFVPVPKQMTISFANQSGRGQGHAVLAAGSLIKDKPALILNGSDIYEDDCIRLMLDRYKKNPNDIALAAMRVTSYFPGGYLKITSHDLIGEIIEKPKKGKEPSDVVRLALDFIPDMKAFCSVLKPFTKRPDDAYERALSAMIKHGVESRSVMSASEWLYLKYPWHVLSVMDACLSSIQGTTIARSVSMGKNTTIEGPVIIEEHVRIMEGTKIVGPVFIGKNSIIGNNNIIRHSHIGEGCVTGFSTDIARSYIGNNCWFHTNYIGDSVLSDNVSMGSGTVLANFRLDESPISSHVKNELIQTGRNKLGAMIGSNVRIGVNVSIMPGVKIGKGSFIGAGVVLGEDLPDGKYCRITPTVVISDNLKKPGQSRSEFKKNL